MASIEIESFDQWEIQRLHHTLADHPLLSTENLCELALRMDPDYVRFHDGERQVGTDMGKMLRTDPTRAGLRRAIAKLPETRAFVQIMNVRSDPVYARLLDEIFGDIVPALSVRDRDLINRDCAIFLASPGSVTPFHLDHEQNFLCHIRGAKTFHVWDHRDRAVVSERALEIFYREGALREVVYRDEVQPKALSIELQPGDCVFMPMGSPHAASTGGDVTVTFSVLLNTLSTFEHVEAYRMNYLLRALGIEPRPVFESPTRDWFKFRALDVVRRARALTRGQPRPERHLRWY